CEGVSQKQNYHAHVRCRGNLIRCSFLQSYLSGVLYRLRMPCLRPAKFCRPWAHPTEQCSLGACRHRLSWLFVFNGRPLAGQSCQFWQLGNYLVRSPRYWSTVGDNSRLTEFSMRANSRLTGNSICRSGAPSRFTPTHDSRHSRLTIDDSRL